jgi:predicted Zn-dependent protease
MHPSDGARTQQLKNQGITLVLFGSIGQELEYTLVNSLKMLLSSLEEQTGNSIPVVCCHTLEPATIPRNHQEFAFFKSLAGMPGLIRLGVTNTGFYSPELSRHLFSYGWLDGSGVLSTYRFVHETGSQQLFLERMGKQIIKTLTLACSMDSCSDNRCVVSYHRWAEDLDKNRYVCNTCMNALSGSLAFVFHEENDDPARIVEKGGYR